MHSEGRIDFSLVIPVFNSETNIPKLIETISLIMVHANEAVFVDDGSPDQSRRLLKEILPKQPWRSQLVAHSRNFGAFSAVRTGLTVANGEAIAVMSDDLQEPSDLIRQFRDILARDEADVVLGQRLMREDGAASDLASTIFWQLFRKLLFPGAPRGGFDMFAINRRARDALLAMPETNTSLIAQLFWIGFRRKFVPYVRQPRRFRRGGWTYRRKLKYMIDSFVSFTDLPLRFQFWAGAIGSITSGLAAIVVLFAWLGGLLPSSGYTFVVLMIVFMFSVLILSQGITGLYLWNAFENTKQRPLAIIAEHTSFEGIGGGPAT